jgi:hypothetical protein
MLNSAMTGGPSSISIERRERAHEGRGSRPPKERGVPGSRRGRSAVRQAFEQGVAINDRDGPDYLAFGETCTNPDVYEAAVDSPTRALLLEERSAR